MKVRRALLSVSDKTGLAGLARSLAEAGPVASVVQVPLPIEGNVDTQVKGRVQLTLKALEKATPAADEYELYDLTNDPKEVTNMYGDPAYAEQQAAMVQILAEQREKKPAWPAQRRCTRPVGRSSIPGGMA